MEKTINIKVKVWRQAGPKAKGAFVTYDLKNISTDSSFLEMLDVLNEQLVSSPCKRTGEIGRKVSEQLISGRCIPIRKDIPIL